MRLKGFERGADKAGWDNEHDEVGFFYGCGVGGPAKILREFNARQIDGVFACRTDRLNLFFKGAPESDLVTVAREHHAQRGSPSAISNYKAVHKNSVFSV